MSAERELLADSTPKPLAQGETIVEFDNVWKTYARRDVLAGVSLKIRKGEVLCVLGPSGTGKSVTIRHINGRYACACWRACPHSCAATPSAAGELPW